MEEADNIPLKHQDAYYEYDVAFPQIELPKLILFCIDWNKPKEVLTSL